MGEQVGLTQRGSLRGLIPSVISLIVWCAVSFHLYLFGVVWFRNRAPLRPDDTRYYTAVRRIKYLACIYTYRVLLLLCTGVVATAAAAVRHRVPDGTYCCWFIQSDSIQCFHSFHSHMTYFRSLERLPQRIIEKCVRVRMPSETSEPTMWFSQTTPDEHPPAPPPCRWPALITLRTPTKFQLV